MRSISSNASEERQARDWSQLYHLIARLLSRYGSSGVRRTYDFWIHDENIGTRQHKIYVRNLALLDPVVIKALQRLLTDFHSWEVMVAVSAPEKDDTWPTMGLTVRSREIIDGLQRQYFPLEFREFQYEGAR